ncbi:MAG: hypothetical protein M1827_005765 [Pycnora praestabilis]|nr:MAG: hypothetical protein M1827_005765 [Pycnora praestabilis]
MSIVLRKQDAWPTTFPSANAYIDRFKRLTEACQVIVEINDLSRIETFMIEEAMRYLTENSNRPAKPDMQSDGGSPCTITVEERLVAQALQCFVMYWGLAKIDSAFSWTKTRLMALEYEKRRPSSGDELDNVYYGSKASLGCLWGPLEDIDEPLRLRSIFKELFKYLQLVMFKGRPSALLPLFIVMSILGIIHTYVPFLDEDDENCNDSIILMFDMFSSSRRNFNPFFMNWESEASLLAVGGDKLARAAFSRFQQAFVEDWMKEEPEDFRSEGRSLQYCLSALLNLF